jgi:hypothetical protein
LNVEQHQADKGNQRAYQSGYDGSGEPVAILLAKIGELLALEAVEAVLKFRDEIDSNGTRRRRPTPSKVAARTASADAMIPFRPAKAAKSRTNAIACRSRPELGGPDSIIPGLFIGRSLMCRADGYRRDAAPVALRRVREPAVAARPL